MKNFFKLFEVLEASSGENRELRPYVHLKIVFYIIFVTVALVASFKGIHFSSPYMYWFIGGMIFIGLLWVANKNLKLDNLLLKKFSQMPKHDQLQKKHKKLEKEYFSKHNEWLKSDEKQKNKLEQKDLQIDELTARLNTTNDKLADQKKKGKEMVILRDEKFELENQIRALKSDVLNNMNLSEITNFLSDYFEQGKNLTEEEKISISAMYAAMHEKCPDVDRVKELAAVPVEIQRLNQIRIITESYSKLITEAELDISLSDNERKDKIKLYRLRRDRELGDEA